MIAGSGNDVVHATNGMGIRQSNNGQSHTVTTNGHHTHQSTPAAAASSTTSTTTPLPSKKMSLTGSFIATTGSPTGVVILSDLSPPGNLLMPIPAAVGVVDRYSMSPGLPLPIAGDVVDHITSMMGVGVGVGVPSSSVLTRPPVRGSPVTSRDNPIVVIKSPTGHTTAHRIHATDDGHHDHKGIRTTVTPVMLESSDEDGPEGAAIYHPPTSYPSIVSPLAISLPTNLT